MTGSEFLQGAAETLAGMEASLADPHIPPLCPRSYKADPGTTQAHGHILSTPHTKMLPSFTHVP